jgi:hypothetical protein
LAERLRRSLHGAQERGIIRPMSLLSRGLLLLAAIALSVPVQADGGATDLASRVPAGSIATRADVERAREAARTTERAAEIAWQAEQERCLGTFFVNACRDRARRLWMDARREVRRVSAEASAQERKLDNAARAEAREAAERAAPTSARIAEREASARAAYDARQLRARENADDRRQREQAAEERRLAQEQRLQEQKQHDAQRAAQAASEAENARRFAQKQADAEAYERRKAQERAENERRRAERQREREQKMIEQGRVPPLSSPAAASGRADAAPPKVDLPADIPPPTPLVVDRPAPAGAAPRK